MNRNDDGYGGWNNARKAVIGCFLTAVCFPLAALFLWFVVELTRSYF